MMKKKFSALFLAGILLFATSCELINDPSNLFNSSSSSSSGNELYADEHVDENEDGICDECQESTLRTFDVFAVNDLHGKLLDTDAQPGVDEMTTYLKQAKQSNPNTILLSSGDMWQGSSESNLTKGLMTTDWMNELDFVSMTLGNHEYDWGESYIEENSKAAEFPFLAINVYNKYTNKRVDYCDASVMIEQDGAKIGIIGAIGDCYSSIAADKTQDVYFHTEDRLTALVMAESDRLREQGADCIIYSVHDGMGNYDDALSDGYVDIVFEGHTHSVYKEVDNEGVYHLQGGGDNKYGLSKATIQINIAADNARIKQAKTVAHSAYTSLSKDPIVEELMDKYEDEIAEGTRALGMNDRYRDEKELSRLVAQLYLEAGKEKWGDEYDVVLGGGSINIRSPYALQAGEVTYADIQMLYPFDNQLELCSILGVNLLDRFINNKSYFVAYDPSLPSSIELNKIYYMVTDTWNSPYVDNCLTVVDRYDETTFARDLLADYVEEGGMTTVKPTPTPTPGDITLTSIADVLELGSALPANGVTESELDVRGKIVEIKSTTWGNMTIEDAEGNQLYIYGTYDSSGEIRYDAMADQPQVGDTVFLRGAIKNYLKDGSSTPIVEMIDGKVMGKFKLTSIPDLLEMGNDLVDNSHTVTKYALECTIVSIDSTTWGNMTVEDAEGNQIYIYGLYDSAGARYDAMSKKPVVGDTLVIEGALMKYVNETTTKIEIMDGVIRLWIG